MQNFSNTMHQKYKIFELTPCINGTFPTEFVKNYEI